MNRPQRTIVAGPNRGHLPTCSDSCAKAHCPCGEDNSHGVPWCRFCGREAESRTTPSLNDGPGVRLAIRANRSAHFKARRAAR
jgi:hypothetical protein